MHSCALSPLLPETSRATSIPTQGFTGCQPAPSLVETNHRWELTPVLVNRLHSPDFLVRTRTPDEPLNRCRRQT